MFVSHVAGLPQSCRSSCLSSQLCLMNPKPRANILFWPPTLILCNVGQLRYSAYYINLSSPLDNFNKFLCKLLLWRLINDRSLKLLAWTLMTLQPVLRTPIKMCLSLISLPSHTLRLNTTNSWRLTKKPLCRHITWHPQTNEGWPLPLLPTIASHTINSCQISPVTLGHVPTWIVPLSLSRHWQLLGWCFFQAILRVAFYTLSDFFSAQLEPLVSEYFLN